MPNEVYRLLDFHRTDKGPLARLDVIGDKFDYRNRKLPISFGITGNVNYRQFVLFPQRYSSRG